MKNQTKIIVLWGLILFGLVFHSSLEMIPLFFGASVAIPDATGTMPESMAWMGLFFYLVPMICIVAVLFLSSKWVKVTNLVIAVLFVLLNAIHFVEDGILGENAVQFVLLAFVLLVTVILFIASLKWNKERMP